MEIWAHRIIGLIIAVVGSLPLFEIVQKGSYRIRGALYRTSRQENPSGYWAAVTATALLAIVAMAAGVAVFGGALKL